MNRTQKDLEQRKAAWRCIKSAGLEQTWHEWQEHVQMPPVTARKAALQWQSWIEQGLIKELSESIENVTRLGREIRSPSAYLNRVMQKHQENKEQQSEKEKQNLFREKMRPRLAWGEEVRLRDGRRARVTAQGEHDTTLLTLEFEVIDIPHQQWDSVTWSSNTSSQGQGQG